MKKDITFIYSDDVEKQVYEMIAEEAKKRGYHTRLTDDKYARCEIGWYCQHINFPQYSRFSVIMLHDITQQYGNWPNIWLREPWNKYDIGFLPNKIWVQNWDQCSKYYYTNPKRGMFLTGWPKADKLSSYVGKGKDDYKIPEGIDPDKPTILYAPAWENDGKQDDFVKAMLPLDVNILIKQAPWSQQYQEQLRNIEEMRKLHENNPRVVQLDPKTSIFDAIMIADILVSEESSTMCECVMMGKPAISVCDWLIPDTTPSRYPADDYDFVIKTEKDKLADCVSQVLEHYDDYSNEAKQYSKDHFSNLGCCIPIMMDILDSFVEGTPCPIPALTPSSKEKMPGEMRKQLLFNNIKREVYWNYCQRSKAMKSLWRIGKGIKTVLIRNR